MLTNKTTVYLNNIYLGINNQKKYLSHIQKLYYAQSKIQLSYQWN